MNRWMPLSGIFRDHVLKTFSLIEHWSNFRVWKKSNLFKMHMNNIDTQIKIWIQTLRSYYLQQLRNQTTGLYSMAIIQSWIFTHYNALLFPSTLVGDFVRWLLTTHSIVSIHTSHLCLLITVAFSWSILAPTHFCPLSDQACTVTILDWM